MTVEIDGGPERDDDAVPGALHDLRVAEDGAVPLEREVLPDGEARRVEAEDGQHQQRQVQKGEEGDGVDARASASYERLAFAPQKGPEQERSRAAIKRDGDGRAEGPVARGGELVLHEVADQHGAAAAEQVGREVGAEAGDEDEHRAGDDAGLARAAR